MSDIENLAAIAPLARGYRFEALKREDASALADSVSEWFPDISVGGASRYLREHFYAHDTFLSDAPEQSNIVLLLKQGEELAGMFACEIDKDTRSVYASLGVAAPRHRGSNLAHAGMMFTEALGRRLKMGFVFGLATLKNTYAQTAFERAGWQLVGIMPGYDREMIAPGVVKRVFEALYAKVLATDVGLLQPFRHNMTPRTRSLFDCVFSQADFDSAAPEELQQRAS